MPGIGFTISYVDSDGEVFEEESDGFTESILDVVEKALDDGGAVSLHITRQGDEDD